MRYLMALMLMWGVVSFSSAQDTQVDDNCPPTSKNEGSTDADQQYDTDDQARMDEGVNSESDIEYDNGETEFDQEIEKDGDANIEYKNDQMEYDMETESSEGLAPADSSVKIETETDIDSDCPNVDATTSDADVEINNNYITPAPEVVNVEVDQDVEKEHSTFGKIWRAPFKMVANVPKAAVSVVSESAEGVGHIVGAPFKGVAKLFGADEDDNDELDKDNM